ncbi:hypothetical protein [Caballeronia sp. Lep1P3]|uniref:hypothetical protein n=1 Tax=Caballeronia sp. Lep1P3 TaxID=2878150 RepID=UPI001FD46ACF|nr:hypothetical protein [Caballeronia sp. Lep1P3]
MNSGTGTTFTRPSASSTISARVARSLHISVSPRMMRWLRMKTLPRHLIDLLEVKRNLPQIPRLKGALKARTLGAAGTTLPHRTFLPLRSLFNQSALIVGQIARSGPRAVSASAGVERNYGIDRPNY